MVVPVDIWDRKRCSVGEGKDVDVCAAAKDTAILIGKSTFVARLFMNSKMASGEVRPF
jgi:hypothetical protein